MHTIYYVDGGLSVHQILVIDHQKNKLYGAVNALLQAGYSIHVIDDAADILSMLRQDTEIAVIVCDASLLLSEGLLADLLKENTRPRLVALIHDQNMSGLDAIRAHVDHFVLKPIRKPDFLRAVLEGVISHVQQEAVRTTTTRASEEVKPLAEDFNDMPLLASSDTSSRDEDDTIAASMSTVRSLTIDHDRSEAVFRGQTLPLTPTEFDILRLLVQAAGRVVSFEDIVYALQKVTVPRNEARRMISAHMTHLRTKMRDVGCDDYLVNSRGRGYMIDSDAEGALERNQGQLHLVLDQMPILLWSVDTNLQFTSITGNHILERFGRFYDELIGISLIEFMGSSEIPAVAGHFQALNGTASQYEQVWIQRIYQVYVQPIYKHNQIIGCSGVAFDITERKQAEEQLRTNQYFIERVISTSPNLIYVYDLMRQRNIYTNEIANKIFGYVPYQMQNVNTEFLVHVLHPNDQHVLSNLPGRYSHMSDGDVLESQLRVRHRDGTWHWVSTREVIFKRNADGSPSQILGILEDITERKQVEQVLKENERRYRRSSRDINASQRDERT